MPNSHKRAEAILKRMKEMARPALRLITAEKPGFSKLGGKPNLPPDFPWPFWHERPLSFIGQFDLAELKVSETLPEFPADGRLYFFYPPWWKDELGQPWGDEPGHGGSAAVIYSRAEPGPPKEPPAEISRPNIFLVEDDTGIYLEHFLAAEPMMSRPAPDSGPGLSYEAGEVADDHSADDPVQAAYDDYCRSCFRPWPVPRHQMGGYPIPDQFPDMALACQLVSGGIPLEMICDLPPARMKELSAGIKDWQLLLQLDSDAEGPFSEKGGDYMAWGNEGLIYFWIRKQDLARLDFSQVWALVQCT